MSNINIATLNLCFGLPNKKDILTELLNRNHVNLCCLQETEIPKNFPEKLLNCGGFTIVLEMSTEKKELVVQSEYLASFLNTYIYQ